MARTGIAVGGIGAQVEIQGVGTVVTATKTETGIETGIIGTETEIEIETGIETGAVVASTDHADIAMGTAKRMMPAQVRIVAPTAQTAASKQEAQMKRGKRRARPPSSEKPKAAAAAAAAAATRHLASPRPTPSTLTPRLTGRPTSLPQRS